MCQQKHYYNTQGRHRIFQVRMRIGRAFPKFQLKGFAFQPNVLFFDKSRIKGNQMRKHKIPSWMAEIWCHLSNSALFCWNTLLNLFSNTVDIIRARCWVDKVQIKQKQQTASRDSKPRWYNRTQMWRPHQNKKQASWGTAVSYAIRGIVSLFSAFPKLLATFNFSKNRWSTWIKSNIFLSNLLSL